MIVYNRNCNFRQAQSKHFLIETEGDNTEVEGEDYGNTLTEKGT